MKNTRRIGGSLEKALNKESDFNPLKVLKEAWGLTLKTWSTLIGAIAVVLVISIAVLSLATLVWAPTDTDQQTLQSVLAIINALVLAPFMGALYIMGMRHSIGETTRVTDIFRFLKRPFALIATLFLTIVIPQLAVLLLVNIHELLAVFGALFLSLSFFMALPLCAEYSLSPFAALKTSFLTITKRLPKFFLIGAVFLVIFVIGLVTYFIAFIFLAPLSVNIIGVLYRELFGVAAESHNSFTDEEDNEDDINRLNHDDKDKTSWNA